MSEKQPKKLLFFLNKSLKMYEINILLATIELQTHLCFIPRKSLDATNFKKEKNSTSTFTFKKDYFFLENNIKHF